MAVAQTASDTPTSALRDPLDALWRAFSAPLAGRILTLAIGVALLLRYVLPQMPPAAHTDPAALAQWTAGLPAFYRAQIGWLRPLGLTDIFGAVWFRALLALAGVGMLVAGADRTMRAWRFLRGAMDAEGPERQWETASPAGDVLAGLRRQLTTRRYLVQTRPADGEAGGWEVRASRPPASALVHAGLLVLLAGLAFNHSLGWRMDGLALPPGESLPLRAGGYELAVEHGDGADAASAIELVRLSQDGRLLAERALQAGGRLHHGSVTVVQRDVGPLVTASATSADEAAVLLEAHPQQGAARQTLQLAFAPAQTQRYFRSLRSGQLYSVERLEGGDFLLSVYRGGETLPALTRRLSPGQAMVFEGETVTLSGGHYVVLDVRGDPAWPAILGGGIIALAGLLLGLAARPSELAWWVREGTAATQVSLRGADPYVGVGWAGLPAQPAEDPPHD